MAQLAALERAAADARRRLLAGEGPILIEAKTYRFLGHYVGDPGSAYRTREEVDDWKKRDPIDLFEKVLLKGRWAGKKDFEKTRDRFSAEIEEAVDFARNSPPPDAATRSAGSGLCWWWENRPCEGL